MTKFLDKSFSVPMSGDQQYRDNWEATFGKKEKPEPTKEPELYVKHPNKAMKIKRNKKALKDMGRDEDGKPISGREPPR